MYAFTDGKDADVTAAAAQDSVAKATLKITVGQQMRRLNVVPGEFGFQELRNEVRKCHGDGPASFTYVDDEGDVITITSDDELAEAFRLAKILGQNGRWTLKISVEMHDVRGANLKNPLQEKDDVKPRPTSDQDAFQKISDRRSSGFAKANIGKAPSGLNNVSRAKKLESRARKLEKKARKLEERSGKISARAEKLKSGAKSAADAKSKPAKPVPLRTSSGGARFFLDGTIESGGGGEARLLPNGTISVVMGGSNFPSVVADGVSLASGKWYYEATVLTDSLMQIGWACDDFTGEADRGNGVGDDSLSWSIDGYRKLRWHGGLSSPWPIQKWNAGDVVCCAVDIDNRVMRFALNGQWSNSGEDTAFSGFTFKDGSGISPAVSFGDGQRLRMNLGAPGTPLKFGPPSPHYAAVWDAYGTPANISKGDKFGRKLHWSEAATAAAAAPATRTGRPGESSRNHAAVEAISEILANQKVRSSISKALAQDSVAEALQAILIASVKAPEQLGVVMTSQLAHITPVYLTLMSECPEILAAVPGLMAFFGRNQGRGQPCKGWSNPCEAQCQQDSSANPGGLWRRNCRQRRQQRRQQRLWQHQQRQQQQQQQQQQRRQGSPQASGLESLAEIVGSTARKILGADADELVQQAIAASLKEAEKVSNFVGKSVEMTAEAAKTLVEQPTTTTSSKGEVSEVATESSSKASQPRAKYINEKGTAHVTASPNEVFHYSWRIKNSGDEDWPEGVIMRSVGGDVIQGTETKITFCKLGAGKETQAKVMFTAPSVEGRYINYWRLFHGDRRFGDRMWLDVTVKSADANAGASANASAIAKDDGNGEDARSESSSAPGSSEQSSQSGNTALDNLTDWVAVADALRASGSPGESASSPLPSEDGDEDAPGHEKYEQQLSMMRSMGFDNDATIIEALEGADGNIGDAVNLILASRS